MPFDEGDEIEGKMHRPDDILVGATERERFGSLIEIPREFVAATAKMIEDL